VVGEGELVEPPQRQLGEHDALVGDLGRQDVVEGGDRVGRHHQDAAAGPVVESSDLAHMDRLVEHGASLTVSSR